MCLSAGATKFMNDLIEIFTNLRMQDGIDEQCTLWWKSNRVANKSAKKGKRTRKYQSKRASNPMPTLPALFAPIPELPAINLDAPRVNEDGEGEVWFLIDETLDVTWA